MYVNSVLGLLSIRILFISVSLFHLALSSGTLDLTEMNYMLFYVGAGDLNSASHVCVASILPTKPSPQLWRINS